jgi:hypothetical protein
MTELGSRGLYRRNATTGRRRVLSTLASVCLGAVTAGGLAPAAHSAQAIRACPEPTPDPSCDVFGLAAALDLAGPDTVVTLAPGVYREGAAIRQPGLVLRGEPGARLHGVAVEGKAALVVKTDDVTVEGIECSGIHVRDNNGACIRQEGRDLTVRDVHFHDNQQGILVGAPGGDLLIENSLFERNGFGGRAHGVYVSGSVDTFTFRGNRVLTTVGAGHGVKSRARRTIIEDNVIASLDGDDSRAIDISDGGDVTIRDNVLQKGPDSRNGQMIGLALEGEPHGSTDALIEHNLFIFDEVDDSWRDWLKRVLRRVNYNGRVIETKATGSVVLRDNVVVGARWIGDGVVDEGTRRYDTRRAAGLPPYPALPTPPAS